jgi:hypothetical protein
MITFTSQTANKNELKNAIWEELVKCTMDAVWPLYNKYEETGFDYSGCETWEDMQRQFAVSFLKEWTTTTLQITDKGVVLNDDLHTDGTLNEGPYNLRKFVRTIKKQFPDVIIQGEGSIDYSCSVEEYKIHTKNTVVCTIITVAVVRDIIILCVPTNRVVKDIAWNHRVSTATTHITCKVVENCVNNNLNTVFVSFFTRSLKFFFCT